MTNIRNIRIFLDVTYFFINVSMVETRQAQDIHCPREWIRTPAIFDHDLSSRGQVTPQKMVVLIRQYSPKKMAETLRGIRIYFIIIAHPSGASMHVLFSPGEIQIRDPFLGMVS